jgi:hypothetical protein
LTDIYSEPNLAEMGRRMFDHLPSLAASFLAHATDAGISYDTDSVRFDARIVFPSATLRFRYCRPEFVSHGLDYQDTERQFAIWCEVRGSVSLEVAETVVYEQTLVWEDGSGTNRFEGDRAHFVDTAQFILRLSPAMYSGLPTVE